MEIKDLILLMWRNVRYIVLGFALGAGLGFFISVVQPPVYEASSKIFVSRTRQQGNSDMLSLSDEQLLAINLQLAKSQPVLNEVSSQLGSKLDADNIAVGAIPNTLIIQIKVQDNDPQRAAEIANSLVQVLIGQNEILLSTRYMGFESAINEQVNQVQAQIDSLQSQISQINDAGIQEQLAQVNRQIEEMKAQVSVLEQEIAAFPEVLSALDRITLAEKQAQLDQLRSLMTIYQQIQTNLTFMGKPGQNDSNLEDPRLTTLQSTLALYRQMNTTLINNRENVRLARMQSRQNVMQIVTAAPPKNPVRPMPVIYLLLGGIVGFVLAATSILMIDHMDDSLKSESQVEKMLDLPSLGFVFDEGPDGARLVNMQEQSSAEAEAFRSLGASVDIVSAGKNIHSLMIVNADPSGIKTAIAANLAILNAQQGKQVILLDGNLKRPHLHSLFGMENKKGFAELLHDRMDIKSARQSVAGVEGLSLICSGNAEKESAAWLDSKKWKQVLLELQKLADLVIVDSPPANSADAQILASKTNAVLMAVQAGRTHMDAAHTVVKKFQLIGARVAGVILYQAARQRKSKFHLPAWLRIKQAKHSETDSEIDASAISLP
jgi:capsular exopolysaccharide synthesis family protein